MNKAIDWKAKEDYAKGLGIGSLMIAAKDCRSAAGAMRGWNPEKENYYIDEASVYQNELYKRNRKIYSLREIQDLLDEEVGDCQIHKGNGYFYFMGKYNIPSIYVMRARDLKIVEVLAEAIEAKKQYEAWEQAYSRWEKKNA